MTLRADMRPLAPACIILLAVACSSADGPRPAPRGADNAGSRADGGAPDAGLWDAGAPDAGAPDAGPPAEAPADRLYRYLAGRFDSQDQADADARYFAVQLLACPVHAPEIGDRVLYVEQALMTRPNAPYRQRLYVVRTGTAAAGAVSEVMELRAPGAWVGQCGETGTATVTAAQAVPRPGCAVHLIWDAESRRFAGGTRGEACASSLNGAAYATSEVTITEDLVVSWDRGFDADGDQVWGAEAGPYEFVRRTPLPE